MSNKSAAKDSAWHRARRGEPKDPCSVPGCQNLRTGNKDICKPHQTRVYKTGNVGIGKPWRHKTGEQNPTCLVPLKDGSLCGKDSRTHPMEERDNPDWKWGRLCPSHYARYCTSGSVREGTDLRRKSPTMPLNERVAHYLDPANGWVIRVDGCLEWQASMSANGAGYAIVPVWKSDNANRTAPWLVHRLVWELHNGPIPPGNRVHHICGTRHCVDIGHLECIGYKENGSEACRIKQFRDKANEPGMTIEALREWIAAGR